MIKKLLFCFFAIFIFRGYAITYNVKDFGAKGDGKTDDTQSITNCFKNAEKNNISEIFFPEGNYIISNTLDFFLSKGELKIIGEAKDKVKIQNISSTSLLSIRGYYQTPSQGKVTILGITFTGSFPTFSENNKFINKSKFYHGVYIADLEGVEIKNVKIENIYGEGISVSTTKISDKEPLAQIKELIIENSEIINCWGYDPKSDSYGDGIYLANVRKGKLISNRIYNDFNITHQLGRSGIVIEYLCSNIDITNNTIFGYDRGIHIEDDLGGHNITENKILGSDLGIVVFNTKDKLVCNIQPLKVVGNYISNQGLPLKTNLKRTRGVSQSSDRSLFNFYSTKGYGEGSIVEKNIFEIDGNYDYYSDSIMNIYAAGVKFNNNSFKVEKKGLGVNVNYHSKANIENETYIGIKNIYLKKTPQSGNFKTRNQINKATLNFN